MTNFATAWQRMPDGDERPRSNRKEAVARYLAGLRPPDRAAIVSLLTEDVAWDLPGYRRLVGKPAFDGERVNPAFDGSPTLAVDRLVEEGDTVVAIGEGASGTAGGGPHRFAFCMVFSFSGDVISWVESYMVAMPEAPAE